MNRSYLFIPGNNPAMLQNADVFQADAVIIDLEDAVHMHEKDSARNLVDQFLHQFSLKKTELYIRLNSIETTFYKDDLLMLSNHNISGLVVPKANQNGLKIINDELDKLGINFKLMPIIENAMAVIKAEQIAQSKRVVALLLGAEDLTSDLEVSRTKSGEEILYARMQLVYMAKAYKLDVIDTPYTDTHDEVGLQKDGLFAKQLGFSGKACIHPNQVEIINNIFVPTEDEILEARRILEANKNAKNGAFSLDGKMIDEPVIKRAEKVMIKAKRFDLL